MSVPLSAEIPDCPHHECVLGGLPTPGPESNPIDFGVADPGAGVEGEVAARHAGEGACFDATATATACLHALFEHVGICFGVADAAATSRSCVAKPSAAPSLFGSNSYPARAICSSCARRSALSSSCCCSDKAAPSDGDCLTGAQASISIVMLPRGLRGLARCGNEASWLSICGPGVAFGKAGRLQAVETCAGVWGIGLGNALSWPTGVV